GGGSGGPVADGLVRREPAARTRLRKPLLDEGSRARSRRRAGGRDGDEDSCDGCGEGDAHGRRRPLRLAARLAAVRGWLLASTVAALSLAVPSAQPAARPARFLLGVTAGGTVSLLQSSDGIRFAPVPGYSPGPGANPAPVRRGPTIYLYDVPAVSASGLAGSVRRFAVGPGGRLAERAPASYQVQLASPEDAQRASAGSFAPSVAVDDAGV